MSDETIETKALRRAVIARLATSHRELSRWLFQYHPDCELRIGQGPKRASLSIRGVERPPPYTGCPSYNAEGMEIVLIIDGLFEDWLVPLTIDDTPVSWAFSPPAAKQLDQDHSTARAVHRVIRAMHDGECPKCGKCFNAPDMRTYRLNEGSGWECPACHFWISDEEGQAAIREFHPFMLKNLEVFEQWRAKYNAAQAAG